MKDQRHKQASYALIVLSLPSQISGRFNVTNINSFQVPPRLSKNISNLHALMSIFCIDKSPCEVINEFNKTWVYARIFFRHTNCLDGLKLVDKLETILNTQMNINFNELLDLQKICFNHVPTINKLLKTYHHYIENSGSNLNMTKHRYTIHSTNQISNNVIKTWFQHRNQWGIFVDIFTTLIVCIKNAKKNLYIYYSVYKDYLYIYPVNY